MRRALAFAGLLGALLVVPAAPALAQQNQIYNDFKKNGQVNPCKYSKGQLQKGLKNLPPDIQQYAPGLADQLRRPCAAAPVATAVVRPPSGPNHKPQAQAVLPTAPSPAAAAIPAPPAPRSKVRRAINAAAPAVSADPGGIDVPLWLQLALLALGASALAFFAAVRYGGVDPESATRPFRAALTEGGDALSDLRHRLPPGRE